ncbi:MAG: hypothetical protein QXP35_03185 [Candidatus Micrarchaeaceae archaeon]
MMHKTVSKAEHDNINMSTQKIIHLHFMQSTYKIAMPDQVYPEFLQLLPSILSKLITKGTPPHWDYFINANYSTPKIELKDNVLTLSSYASPKQFATDIILAASKLLEFEINKNSIYSIHGAAVAYKNKGFVFLGPYGSGKTTSAINCCLLDDELNFISGNRLFISKSDIIERIPGINLRKGSIVKEFDGRFNKMLRNSSGEVWEEKKILLPSEIGLHEQNSYPVSIDTLIVVKKLPREDIVINTNMKDSLFLMLFESLSVYSDNLPLLFLGGRLPFPSLFSYEDKKARIEFAQALFESTKIIYIEGQLDNISHYIIKNIIKIDKNEGK